ncbi:Vacuolar iron transporter [Lecanosticta acicola]|uniref:Vacuolar iron transporter n=1 Tax=Lecanosticta acicola TaxID=111012 RepID=A0AAI8W0R2_9PEZI|nr:Vacuolar iron transporter [Lecanosticta acicola]
MADLSDSGRKEAALRHHEVPGELESGTASSAASTRSKHRGKRAGQGVFVRDGIVGFADGLTVPFALTAGLTNLGDRKVVILGGLAELFAGAISMGLGAYLAAVTEQKHFEVEQRRERRAVAEFPAEEEEGVYRLLGKYGLGRERCRGVVEGLKADVAMWVLFVMDFEVRLEKASTRMAWMEGLVMGVAYFLGGLLPMIPYFAMDRVNHALFVSIGITAVILVVFGYVKALVTGTTHGDAAWSSVQTLAIGAVAAAVSYGIVRGLSSATTA